MDYAVLMDQLVNLDYPALGSEDEELARSIYHLVINDVVTFALAIQNVPPAVHLESTPYVTGILFRNRFGRIVMGQMVITGPERYSSVGMRLGKLIIQTLVRHKVELYNIEFLLYLFLKVANETIHVLTHSGQAAAATAVPQAAATEEESGEEESGEEESGEEESGEEESGEEESGEEESGDEESGDEESREEGSRDEKSGEEEPAEEEPAEEAVYN